MSARNHVAQRVVQAIAVCFGLAALLTAIPQPARAQCALCGTDNPPTVSFTPTGGLYSSSSRSVTVHFCDDHSVNTTTAQIKLNGTSVIGSLSSTGDGSCSGTGIKYTGTVTLQEGSNTLYGYICDYHAPAQCTSGNAYYTLDSTAPTVTIDPDSGTYTSSSRFVTVTWHDSASLNMSTRSLTLNGASVTASFNYYSGSGSGVTKIDTGTVTLTASSDTLIASVQDNAGNTGADTAIYAYTAPESPLVNLNAYNSEYRDVAQCVADCFDASVSYTTPAYVSLDAQRSVTLLYRSSMADPKGRLNINAENPTGAPTPSAFKLRVKPYGSGTWLNLTNGSQALFWSYGTNWQRLGAVFTPANDSTGAWKYVARVYSVVGSSQPHTDHTFWVLLDNERQSPYGAGWWIEGLQQLHVMTDGAIVVTEGDGSVARFPQQNSTTWNSPAGDFTTLVKTNDTTYTRTYPDSTVLSFRSNGQLKSVADRFGNETDYSYDGSGRVTAITDPVGKEFTFSYNGSGYTITGPASRTTTVTIDGSGDLTEIDDPTGAAALQATYDSSHRMLHRTDRRGGSWGFAYDFAGKVKADTMPQVTADGGTTRPVVHFRSLDFVIDSSTNGSGHGTSSSPAPALTSWNTKPSVTSPEGETTQYRLTKFLSPSWIIPPLGSATHIWHNADAQVTHVDVPSGDTIDYTWDGAALASQTDEAQNRTIHVADTTYNLPSHIWGDVTEQWFYYDNLGRLDSTRVGSSSATPTSFTYDSLGRVLTQVDPQHHETKYGYASTGYHNMLWVKSGVDSTLSTDYRITNYVHDGKGRTTQVIDPESDTTWTAYDALNRVTRGIDARHDTTSRTYDSLYLTGVTDATGNSYSFTPNALGWVTERTDPNGYSDDYAYDKDGRVKSWTNRVGQTVTFAYDALGNLTSRAEGGDTTTYKTDPDGGFVAASNAASTDTITYDAAGRVVDQITHRGSHRYVLESEYDGDGRRTSLAATTPWTKSVTYGYDAEGLLDSLVDAAGGVTHFGYDAERELAQVAYPTGDTLWRDVSSSHRTSALTWNSAALEKAFGQAFSEDSKGRRTAAYRGASGDTSRVYTYDAASRLKSYEDRIATGGITCTPGSIDPNDCTFNSGYTVADSALYSYDAVGNRTDHSAVIGTGDRPSSFDGYSLTWDHAGRLTQKSGNGLTEDYYWSATGRLDSVTARDTTWRFTYDGFGRRIKRGRDGWSAQFLWDGGRLFMSLSGSGGTLEATYSNLPGLDAPLAQTRGSSTSYYATDDLGSVEGLFNGSGVQNQDRYYPWGEPQVASGSVSNPLRYAGLPWNKHTGLSYMRARYYDPGLGRFISEDPLGLSAGINPYVYAANSPMNATDPTGMDVCWQQMVTWFTSGGKVIGVDAGPLVVWNCGSSGGSDGSAAAGGGSSGWNVGDQAVEKCREDIGLATLDVVVSAADVKELKAGATFLVREGANVVRHFSLQSARSWATDAAALVFNREMRQFSTDNLRGAVLAPGLIAGVQRGEITSLAGGAKEVLLSAVPFRGAFKAIGDARTDCFDPQPK